MIDWGQFLIVLLVSVVSACFVVTVYSSGLRLWSTADTMAGRYSMADDGTVGPSTVGVPGATRPLAAVRAVRALAIVCFIVCALTVLYGIYLVVPQFH